MVRLTCHGPMPTLAGFRRCRRRQEGDTRVDEAHVPAQRSPPEEDARIPQPHGHQGWAQGPQAAARQGAKAPDGIAGRLPRRERLTSSSAFQALFRTGQRINRPLMVVLWRRTEAGQPRQAGFTVSRQVHGAVARNRVKRRLRAAYRETRDEAPAEIALVVIGRPGMLSEPMAAVTADMRRALGSIL